jgi:hypothetical protein
MARARRVARFFAAFDRKDNPRLPLVAKRRVHSSRENREDFYPRARVCVASLEFSSETPQTVVSGFFSVSSKSERHSRELERAPRQSASEAEARWADFSRAKD